MKKTLTPEDITEILQRTEGFISFLTTLINDYIERFTDLNDELLK